jgi:transcriptional regulator with XRE-family HTH domain
MEPPEERRQRVRREKQLSNRLQLATIRLEAAQQERLWAIAAAYEAGLSMRKIATATGLSSSRVHQLLRDEESREVSQWLSQLREQKSSSADGKPTGLSSPETDFQARLAEEVETLRWCIGWLEQLARGETVVVNLRVERDPKTAFVAFDQARVLRVLKRIAADLDELSGRMTLTENNDAAVDTIAANVKHRQRLAEPEPELSSLSQREQRAIVREKMGLPPSYDPHW